MPRRPNSASTNLRSSPSTTDAWGGALPPPTPSERAFEALLESFDDTPVEQTRAAAMLDDLFARSATFLERDRYGSIGEAFTFNTKIVGVSFEGRQDRVAGLVPGNHLELVREPDNPHDANAIAVRFGTIHVGFLRREIARHVAPNMDAGAVYSATVEHITGGGDRHTGVNIVVQRSRPLRAAASAGATSRAAADGEALVRALIGAATVRETQAAVIERVRAGQSTLAVFGTGRGKSFCFQLPAAQGAFEGKKTLVLYPLRALTNDQHQALVRRLEPLGLRVLRANGAIDGSEREELQAALADGAWDICLSTPEFASFHRASFAEPRNRPSLLVVDEAHHIYESRHRPAYANLGALRAELGEPPVLALTATASEAAFAQVRRALGIDAWVIDPTVRENLHVVDARSASDKFAYLSRSLDGESKAIVYCNSRTETTKVAERLRASFGPRVGFYHAGMPSADRATVEALFRSGDVRVVVATSAFGEGIDLPDVRDVVLYHLNFSFTEFNQQAGRAGRDGAAARIHLLYGDGDRRINDYIIARSAPTLVTLRGLYRSMRELAADGVLRMTYEDVARTLELDMVDGSTVSTATRIFEEGGLVQTGIDEDGRFVRFLTIAGRVDLTATTRYQEGQAERDAFERFCSLALEAAAEELLRIVNRPIYPNDVPLRRPGA